MSEFEKVKSMEELSKLNEIEILEGYRAGIDNQPAPGSDKSKSFWHGWRNGMADMGRIEMDDAMIRLAREYTRGMRCH